ncbi:uncharacterized protein LOC124407137 [Diprion similis]|uniref:uncharacterized protein LOC124407137 n=1 Tax=Diprion similis TaxID=362088 RepID=UPI001EF78210|nr:uncharacterized protein LOC124407137 [Diprion similis]
MLLRRKGSLNILNVFIVGLVTQTEIVTSLINYAEIRRNETPIILESRRAMSSSQLLEMDDNWAVYRPSYTLQQATEHFLHYGAFLRNQILDTFGALVYDRYDDFSTRQLEALYKVYQATLRRKYNIFDIAPSVLEQPDIRSSSICRHINNKVRTCLRRSSQLCGTIQQHTNPNPRPVLTRVFNVTRHMFKTVGFKQQFPEGFSLPTILQRLKSGDLSMTSGLVSGLLQNVQYGSFNDEVRTAEKNVMSLLMSERWRSGRKLSDMPRDQLREVSTVNELLKSIFDGRKSMYHRNEKNFDVLSQHIIVKVDTISPNIEILGTVYDNNTIHLRYLFDVVLPPDDVDSDISDAKNYLLKKMRDFDMVRKYLKVEKYQQSGPDQLLMEILRQMRDINFAPDLVTALQSHVRFWHQSRMINNLNDLLDLFDSYENLRNVPKFSNLVSLMDDIRSSLMNSKTEPIELLCSKPRSCLQRGLKIIAACAVANPKIKYLLVKLFEKLNPDGSIYIDNCKRSTNQVFTEILEPSLQARSGNPGEVTSKLTVQNDSNNPESSTVQNTNNADHETAKKMIAVENSGVRQVVAKQEASEKPSSMGKRRCLECLEDESFESDFSDYFDGDLYDSSSSEEEEYRQGDGCIGNNCPPPWMSNKAQQCADGKCEKPSLPEHPTGCVDPDCIQFPPQGVSPPECSDSNCNKPPDSNKLVCNGNKCRPSGEVNLWTLNEGGPIGMGLLYKQCNLKDIYYQRRLHRLEKIHSLDSVYSTKSVSTEVAASSNKDSSAESHGRSSLPKKQPQSSHLGRSAPRKSPQNEVLTRLNRTESFSSHPLGSRSELSDIGSGIKFGSHAVKNLRNKYRKMNVNESLGRKNRHNGLRRHFKRGSRGVVAEETRGSEVKPPRNADYQSAAVDDQVVEHPGVSNH